MKYKLISDPGHGWLKVPLLQILQLDIAGKISTCSYIDASNKFVYLEEDCDLAVFARAKGWPAGSISEHLIEVFEEHCNIRQMQSFNGKHWHSVVEFVTG